MDGFTTLYDGYLLGSKAGSVDLLATDISVPLDGKLVVTANLETGQTLTIIEKRVAGNISHKAKEGAALVGGCGYLFEIGCTKNSTYNIQIGGTSDVDRLLVQHTMKSQ